MACEVVPKQNNQAQGQVVTAHPGDLSRSLHVTNPNNALCFGQIVQNYHRSLPFALIDLHMGNLPFLLYSSG